MSDLTYGYLQRSSSNDSASSTHSFTTCDTALDLLTRVHEISVHLSSSPSHLDTTGIGNRHHPLYSSSPISSTNPAASVGTMLSMSEATPNSSDLLLCDPAMTRFPPARKSHTWDEHPTSRLEEDVEEEEDMISTYPPAHTRFIDQNPPNSTHSPSTASPSIHTMTVFASSDPLSEYFTAAVHGTSFCANGMIANQSESSSTDDPCERASISFGQSPSTAVGTEGSDSLLKMSVVDTSSSPYNLSPSTSNVSVSSNSPTPPARPASVGPLKIHKRMKSGKRELLKGPRMRSDRVPNLPPLSASSSSSSSSSSPPASSSRESAHSRVSSSSSNSSMCSYSDAFSSPRYDVQLPQEIWQRVFSFLQPTALLDLQCVSRSWPASCWNSVESVDMTGKMESRYSPQAWLRYLPRMSSLRVLVLSRNVPTNEALEIVQKLPKLEILAVVGDHKTSAAGLLRIAELKNLTKLSLYLPTCVRPSALQSLIPHLSSLQHFKIETLRNSFCESAFTSLDSMVNLKTLDLSWCKRLSPAIFARIAKLHHLETLILDMCGCDVTMSGIAHLRVLPNLSELSLRWCEHLTDTMLPTLASFPSLTKLDVSFCKYISLAAIARWLPHISVSHALI